MKYKRTNISEEKLVLIQRILRLAEGDFDIINKMHKAIDFAYAPRTVYVAAIQLDSVKNNGEEVLKTGWTRNTVDERFSDRRNGYTGVNKLYEKFVVSPKMAEEVNKHINKKFACGVKGAKHIFMGKTEMIDIPDSERDEVASDVIKEIKRFIEINKHNISGRGKVN